MTITTDASPWGIGAFLELNGQIESYSVDGITGMDREIMSLSDSPSSSDQQVFEVFALLVALREWAPLWTDRRVQLSVKSDNVATLTLICKMQPHSE